MRRFDYNIYRYANNAQWRIVLHEVVWREMGSNNMQVISMG